MRIPEINAIVSLFGVLYIVSRGDFSFKKKRERGGGELKMIE